MLGILDEPGEVRKILAEEAARRYERIRLCPEDIENLENRINSWIESNI